MKFSTLLLIFPLLAAAKPVPVAEAEAAPGLLGLSLPDLAPGLNLPLLGGATQQGTGAPIPTGTSTAPSSIPTDQVSAVLTPILENLGVPHQEVKSIVDVVNKLLSNSGLLPGGLDLLNILPKGISGETLDTIGTALTQILQGILPGQPTADLVKTVITTLQTLTQIKPNPVAPGISTSAKAAPTPGVVPGVDTLLNAVLNLLDGIDSKAPTSQLSKQLKALTTALKQVTDSAKAGGAANIPPNVLTDLLQKIVIALNRLLTGLSPTKALGLSSTTIPLLGAVGSLLGTLTSVAGLDHLLGGLLGQLLGGLAPGSGTLGGAVAGLLNGLLGTVNGGLLKNPVSDILGGLHL